MNLNRYVSTLVRWMMLIAGGAVVMQTSSCTIEDLLTTYGLSTLISSLLGTATT